MSEVKSSDELSAVFAEAARIAEHVPEALRPFAFQRAVDELLGRSVPVQQQAPPLNEIDERASAPTRQREQNKSRVKGRAKTTVGSPQTTHVRKHVGRPGPKSMLEELIAEGFFDEARDVGSMITQVQQKRGYRYKGRELSTALGRLLREKKLNRDLNGQGQYEYRRPA